MMMSIRSVLRLLLFFLTFIAAFDNCLEAAKIIVSRTSETNTIRHGLESASDGDTIIVRAGVYNEAGLLIDRQLCILGEAGTVIDGRLTTEIITIDADNVEIGNLTVRNVASSYTKDNAAIRLRDCRGFDLHDLRLENVFFGIYLQNADDGKVVNNLITGNDGNELSSGNAIHLWHCNNIIIDGNDLSHARDGIYLEFVAGSSIQGNNSHNNSRYGLHFMFSNDDKYTDNIFHDNGAGVAVMFSKQILMKGNLFEQNWGPASYGLLLKEINDAEIQSNIFIDNTIGISAEGSNRIRYSSNAFTNNGWAIRIRGACFENVISRNNFIGNTFEISYSGQMNRNTFDGNYWSGYSGYDLNNDGIGDVPYRPVKLFDYVVNDTPEAIVLLRSFFVGLLNLSEDVSPVFVPDNLMDNIPAIKPYSL